MGKSSNSVKIRNISLKKRNDHSQTKDPPPNLAHYNSYKLMSKVLSLMHVCPLLSALPFSFPCLPTLHIPPPPLFICFLITKHPNKCRDINFGLSPVFQWDTGMSWQVWWIGGGTFWEIIYVIVLEWVKETLRKDRILCIMDIGYLTKSHGLLSEPKREAVSQNSTSIFHKTFDTKRHIISRTLVPT